MTPDKGKIPRQSIGTLIGRSVALILVSVGLISCVQCWSTRHSTNQREDIPGAATDKNRSIEIATEEAIRLEYETEKLEVSCELVGDRYIVKFLPPPSLIGGDLIVEIDVATGQIIEVIKGQ